MDYRYSLIGLIIGFLIGMTGMGGGSLMTPIMILVMGVKPLVAVGTDLAYGAITRLVGGAAHWRQGTVHRKSAYLLAIGSVPATILGVGITSYIKRTHPDIVNTVILHSLAWALIVVAFLLALKPLISRAAKSAGMQNEIDVRDRLQSDERRNLWLLPVIGGAAGFLVGLTSVGAGSIVIVALLFLYPRWESKELVGTDVFHAAILVSAASMAQLAAGNVNVSMMLSLLIGSIPGVLLGTRFAVGVPEQLLRYSMASVLLVSGAKLL